MTKPVDFQILKDKIRGGRHVTGGPGRYTLQVQHPNGGMRWQQEVVVRAGEPVRLRIEFH